VAPMLCSLLRLPLSRRHSSNYAVMMANDTFCLPSYKFLESKRDGEAVPPAPPPVRTLQGRWFYTWRER